MADTRNGVDRNTVQGGSMRRAPRDDVRLFTPKIVLDGGQAVHGDVSPPAIACDKFVDFPGGGTTKCPHTGTTNQISLSLRWTFDCLVVQWLFYNANDEDPDKIQGLLAVKAQLRLGGPDLEEMIMDGQNPKFIALAALCPPSNAAATWQPIYRVVRNGDIWDVTFQNTHSTNDYFPDLLLGVRLINLCDDGSKEVSPEKAV